LKFLLVLLLSFSAHAQQGKVWKIGMLSGSESMQPIAREFIQGMAALGYVEGRNVEYVHRVGDGTNETAQRQARELVAAKVHLLWAPGTAGTLALRKASGTLPVVFSQVSDPVGSGFVQSLARPGTNATGLTNMNVESGAKRIELLDEIFPNLRRVGVLHNPADAASMAQLPVIATSLLERKKEMMLAQVTAQEQFEAAFASLAQWKADAIVILENSITVRHRKALIELATRYKWPTINSWVGFAEDGGVISYGSSWGALARRSAVHVDKILKGARPGDLPVERPTDFELVVNLKAAKALGLTIPRTVLLRADRVIE
jgi:putative ABC transport system substrate-binding protein